jgi:hypothetical protein
MGTNEIFRLAATIVVGIIVVVAIMVLGDYLGYKFGRMKLATFSGFAVLGVIIIFAIYAIIFAVTRTG